MGRGVILKNIIRTLCVLAFAGSVFLIVSGCGDIAMRSVIDDLTTEDLEWEYLKKITAEGDAADTAHFGYSVAISDNYAIVGAYKEDTNTGAAYIFKRNGDSWERQAKLTPNDAVSGILFGRAVAISDYYAVVGAPLHTSSQGRIYIFERSGSSWNHCALNPRYGGSTAANDFFGYSVSISGSYIIAGAPYHDDVGTDEGAAYIFYRSGTWNEQDEIGASDSANSDLFGASVYIQGSRTVIGATGDDTNTGSAYIFERSGTNWNQKQKITASNGASNDEYGCSVSLSNNIVVVGSKGADSVYVYKLEGSLWNEKTILSSENTNAGDYFGYSVSISGDYIIGAANQTTIGTSSGYIAIFEGSSSSWNEIKYFKQTGLPNNADFGNSVAMTNDHAIVGAPNDDVSGNNEAGSAFVYCCR